MLKVPQSLFVSLLRLAKYVGEVFLAYIRFMTVFKSRAYKIYIKYFIKGY